jgi:glutamyl-Q tRNA(Asp) synthetase
LVLSTNGEKLSKQNGAQALDLREPMTALNQAAAVLGLSPLPHQTPVAQALQVWVEQVRSARA